jgi:hypothetical protein
MSTEAETYRFPLRGNEQFIQAIAYTHGFHMLSLFLHMAKQDSRAKRYNVATLVTEWLERYSIDRAFEAILNEVDIVTNNRIRLYDIFASYFTKGYKFALYANLIGHTDTHAMLKSEPEASYIFGWNTLFPEEAKDVPDKLQDTVNTLNRLHEQFSSQLQN